jgi:hypothetical protein
LLQQTPVRIGVALNIRTALPRAVPIAHGSDRAHPSDPWRRQ